MVTTKIITDYARAVAEANRHRHLYYSGEPEISDAEYDLLERAIKTHEVGLPYEKILPNSPSRRVGIPVVTTGEKITHVVPMLSLDNAMSREEASSWWAKVTDKMATAPVMICEPKFDGVALSIVYRDGKLEHAITRGDGVEGEDVTANSRTIANIPLQLQEPYPSFVEVRGEVIITHEDLANWNKENSNKTLKNARNGAVGSLKLKDPKECAKRPLTFYAHGVGVVSEKFTAYMEIRQEFARMGIPVYPEAFPVQTFSEAQEIYEEFFDTREDANIDFDGMVLKIDNFKLHEELGVGRTAPKWAVAYKFPAETALALVLSIDLQVGRTGAITPVARIEPTDLMGTTISNISLHNPAQIKRLDVAPDCVVEIARAGDVIPQVLRVVNRSPNHCRFDDAKFDFCPSCMSKTDRSQVIPRCMDGVFCDEQKQARLEYFADRMGMKGIGPRYIKTMVEQGVLQIYSDFFILDRADIEKALEEDCKFGKGQIKQLFKAVTAGRKSNAPDLLAAIGLSGLGDVAAQEIVGPGIEPLLKNPSSIDQVSGVSSPARQSFKVYFGNKERVRNFEWMLQQITRALVYVLPGGGRKLSGKSFCLTGTLSKKRKDYEALIRQHGGIVKSAVSKSLDYLVVGQAPGSKEAKAKQFGIPCIPESDLVKMMK